MKNRVYNLYLNMDSKRLRVLRSQKYNRIHRLESEGLGYFMKKDIEALREQMAAIDAILASRDHQPGLWS